MPTAPVLTPLPRALRVDRADAIREDAPTIMLKVFRPLTWADIEAERRNRKASPISGVPGALLRPLRVTVDELRTCHDGWTCVPTPHHVEVLHPTTRHVLQRYVKCHHCGRDIRREDYETDEAFAERDGAALIEWVTPDGARESQDE